jgi:anti-sigma factor RsiW
MENHFLMTDDILWDYADGFLSNQEKLQVDAYLTQHPEWHVRLQAVLAEKRELSALPLEAPAPGFSDRVMAAWAAEHVATKAAAKGDDWIVRLIAVVFGLFVLTPVVVMVVAALRLSPEEAPALELPQVALPTVSMEAWLDSAFLQYGLLLAFVFIGLRFLDKVLRYQLAPRALA